MTSPLVLFVLLTLGLASDVTGANDLMTRAVERRRRDVCSQHANGCSIPGDLPFVYKTEFTSSCNHHDLCYSCGALLGITRDECDEYFRNNMMGVCASLSRRRDVLWRKTRGGFGCTAAAQIYYEAVRLAGGSYYNELGATDSYCTTDLIHACVP